MGGLDGRIFAGSTGAPYPAWSAIGISELITEGTLIEIRVIAKRSGRGAPDEPLPASASKYCS